MEGRGSRGWGGGRKVCRRGRVGRREGRVGKGVVCVGQAMQHMLYMQSQHYACFLGGRVCRQAVERGGREVCREVGGGK